MLVIGHRGAAGDAPENTLESLRHGFTSGADMLEFDVQLTRDGIPIVIHDATLYRTHKKRRFVRFTTYEKINQLTADGHKVALLEDVLDEFFGNVILNLELKSSGSAATTMKLLKSKYIKQPEDWDNLLISSLKVSELYTVRRYSKRAQIALLHYRNPLKFLFVQRSLNLTALGFHYIIQTEPLIRLAKKAGLFTYAYTVNQPIVADHLAEKGLDAIVTDYPSKMHRHLRGARSV